jgi:hypothetical protein
MSKRIPGLSKVSPGPAMPDPSTPCGQAAPKMGWPACRAGGLQPSSTPLDTPRRTGLVGNTRYDTKVIVPAGSCQQNSDAGRVVVPKMSNLVSGLVFVPLGPVRWLCQEGGNTD